MCEREGARARKRERERGIEAGTQKERPGAEGEGTEGKRDEERRRQRKTGDTEC